MIISRLYLLIPAALLFLLLPGCKEEEASGLVQPGPGQPAHSVCHGGGAGSHGDGNRYRWKRQQRPVEHL